MWESLSQLEVPFGRRGDSCPLGIFEQCPQAPGPIAPTSWMLSQSKFPATAHVNRPLVLCLWLLCISGCLLGTEPREPQLGSPWCRLCRSKWEGLCPLTPGPHCCGNGGGGGDASPHFLSPLIILLQPEYLPFLECERQRWTEHPCPSSFSRFPHSWGCPCGW